MYRLAVTLAINCARLAASLYARSENGATPPGRWHAAHCRYTIGATSRVQVVGVAAAAQNAAVTARRFTPSLSQDASVRLQQPERMRLAHCDDDLRRSLPFPHPRGHSGH